MTYAEAYQQAYRELTQDGGQPTDEELVARTRAIMGEAPQSRTEGAPSAEMPVDEDLTPPGYTSDLRDRTRQLEDGGQSNPLPVAEEYMLDGDILQYRPGMTQEEYDAAKANQRHRVGMIRGMGGDGGFGAQVHSQQVMDLGTAEQQQEWRDWVAGDPARMQRYDPAAFQAWLTEKRNREAQSHARGLRERWGDPAASAYLESQRTGAPMDMRTVRTTAEQKRIDDRRRTERAAREEGPEGPAREELYAQDSRSGYSGAIGGAGVSGRWSAIPGPDGSLEHKGQRFARRTSERKQALNDRLKAYTDRNMLAGNDPRQNLVNAYNTLAPEMQQQAMLGMMFPDGATPLDVQQARAMAEARLSANAAGATNINNPLVAQQVEASQQEKREAMLRDAESYVTSKWADQQGLSNYLNRLAIGMGLPLHDNTMFTVAEQQKTVEYLVQKYNITEQEARAIVDTIAATRTTEAPASSQSPPQAPGGPQRPPNGWR